VAGLARAGKQGGTPGPDSPTSRRARNSPISRSSPARKSVGNLAFHRGIEDSSCRRYRPPPAAPASPIDHIEHQRLDALVRVRASLSQSRLSTPASHGARHAAECRDDLVGRIADQHVASLDGRRCGVLTYVEWFPAAAIAAVEGLRVWGTGRRSWAGSGGPTGATRPSPETGGRLRVQRQGE
jgi:hypothetical protein